jgi:hypothetical protein
MKITLEIPDSSVMLTVNALYRAGDDLRLTSACVNDPGDGEKMELDGIEVVKQ